MKQNQSLRPMMKVNELIPYLKKKNIKFEKISESDAEKYLRDNNIKYSGEYRRRRWIQNSEFIS